MADAYDVTSICESRPIFSTSTFICRQQVLDLTYRFHPDGLDAPSWCGELL